MLTPHIVEDSWIKTIRYYNDILWLNYSIAGMVRNHKSEKQMQQKKRGKRGDILGLLWTTSLLQRHKHNNYHFLAIP